MTSSVIASHPEDHHAAGRRSRKTEEPRDSDERPRSGRDELEDADEVVHRRVIGSDVVAVIEAEDLRRDYPRREGCEQDEDLYSDRKGRERSRDRVGKSEPEHVRGEEQSPHEPAAATAPTAYPPPPEDLERAAVDGVQHAVVQDEVLGEDCVGRVAGRSHAWSRVSTPRCSNACGFHRLVAHARETRPPETRTKALFTVGGRLGFHCPARSLSPGAV